MDLGQRTIRTSDVDDQSALLSDWNQSYDQMSPGRFSGRFSEARLDGLHLFREVTSAALFQSGGLKDDVVAIGIPIALEGLATFCGRPCQESQLHLFSGRSGFEFISPSALDIVGAVLPRQSFLACLMEEERHQFSQTFDTPCLISAPAEKIRLLRETIIEILTLALPEGADADREKIAASIQRDLREVLAEAALPPSPQEVLPGTRKVELVREAREIAAADRAEGPVTIEELCRSLDISRRTLQYCFNEVMGMAPASFLRLVRLNGARRSIKEAASVTEAAADWGFWHFGRFAREYRALFGELPSATLRRG